MCSDGACAHLSPDALRQTLDFVARNCFPDPSGNGEVAKQRVQDIVELLHLGGEAAVPPPIPSASSSV